jgi:hypothetical protein
MELLRRVELAQVIAAPIVGDELARDIAHDVAVFILEWGWYRWTDEAVERLAMDFATKEAQYLSRHVRHLV